MKRHEMETIINFNDEEKIAYIFTYNKSWQKHLEKELGLKPTMTNGFGGKAYEIDKNRIKMPRKPKQMSEETKKNLNKALKKARETRLKSKKAQPVVK